MRMSRQRSSRSSSHTRALSIRWCGGSSRDWQIELSYNHHYHSSMELNRITLLSEYKNIPLGGTLVFSKQNYTSLVGANGSGKSNWIEVVASVILHVLEDRVPAFEYCFFLDDKTEVRWQRGQLSYKVEDLAVEKSALDLPKHLIVCYSGEDHRLWDEILMDSYARYFGVETLTYVEEPCSLYVNRYQWAIALIILMCSQKQEVKDFVEELWGGALSSDQIQVKIELNDKRTGYEDPDTQKILEQIAYYDRLSMREVETFDIEGIDPADNNTFCKRLFYLLYALSMPIPNSNRGIHMQKAITNVKIESSNGLSLVGLSEGHKKRILIMLMTQILGNQDTVYLLDEPDAHVDVAAKSKILGLIENAPGHVLLTTHSPLMTRNMKKEAVQTVKGGNVNSEEWSKIIDHLSDHQFSDVGNFLITMKRKVVITEGKYDVLYIREAVSKLKASHPNLEKLENVALISIGGTGETEYFLNNSLDPVMGFLDKVVIIFDKDDAGRKGFNEAQKYVRDNGYHAKVEIFKYAPSYPDSSNDVFYVEDYFPSSCYVADPNIITFNIHGQPSYHDMKKMEKQCVTIKSYLANNYMKVAAADYDRFLPLLNEIINKLGL